MKAGLGAAAVAASAVASAIPANGLTLVTGWERACALLDDGGALKCWGENGDECFDVPDEDCDGKSDLLGLPLFLDEKVGDTTDELGASLPEVRPVAELALARVTAGNKFTCALLAQGAPANAAIKCWGVGSMLGYGSIDSVRLGAMADPTALPFVDLGSEGRIVDLFSGDAHSCALFEDSRVKCWGRNSVQELGFTSDGYAIGDEAGEMGDRLPFVDLDEPVKDMCLGDGLTCALLRSGSVHCWGNNNRGQLGIGETKTDLNATSSRPANLAGAAVASLACGDKHVCVVLMDGALKCWGANSQGALGYGDAEDRGDEPGSMGAALVAVDLAGMRVAKVVAGIDFTCVLAGTEKQVFCWGFNTNGVLGRGDTVDRGTKAEDMGSGLVPLDLGSGEVEDIEAGGHFACVVMRQSAGDQAVRCWGANWKAQLGNGKVTDGFTDSFASTGDQPGEMGVNLTDVDLTKYTLPPTPAPTFFDDRQLEIVAKTDQTCVHRTDGRLKCWGGNFQDSLGLPLRLDSAVGDAPGELGPDLPEVLAVDARPLVRAAVGTSFACATFAVSAPAAEAVKCWGWGNSGRLGYGSTEDQRLGALADPTTLAFVDLGSEGKVVDVACGDAHSCALFEDGRVKCWGANAQGQLGLGTNGTESVGAAEGDMGDALDFVALPKGARQLCLGWRHTCAVLRGGDVYCWGEKWPVPTHVDLDGLLASSISCGGYHACAVVNGGTVKCWGRNSNGQLGLGDTDFRDVVKSESAEPEPDDDPDADEYAYTFPYGTETIPPIGVVPAIPFVDVGGRRVIKVALGYAFTCVLAEREDVGLREVLCWGANGAGQLGRGDVDDYGLLPEHMGPDLAPVYLGEDAGVVEDLAAGRDHVCAVLQRPGELERRVRCWGGNAVGQLGLGSVENVGDEPGEMQSMLADVDLRDATSVPTAAPTAAPSSETTQGPTAAPTAPSGTPAPTGEPSTNTAVVAGSVVAVAVALVALGAVAVRMRKSKQQEETEVMPTEL